MTVRIGLLGAGRIGRVHASAIGRLENACLAVVHDPVDAAADEIARATGARKASSTVWPSV